MTLSLVAPPSLTRCVQAAHAPPAEPYRSLASFRFADTELLVARNKEVERLLRLVTMYRGVLLYGRSGVGKSSIVNAGLLPRVIDEGFWPHRVRVQPPRVGKAFVVEPIACSDQDADAFLPSAFDQDPGARVVLDVKEFDAAVSAVADHMPILLVLDQFEELVTLFGPAAGDAERAQQIIDVIIDLLRHEWLRVKLLFVFREDYLASLKPLLEAQPELSHQYLRLESPPFTAAKEIIRAPFVKFPGHYPRELSSEMADLIPGELADRGDQGELNLSELQIVCSRLWKAPDPEGLLTARGAEGLLEDHLDEALQQLPPAVQDAAMAILVNMITPTGTRNVVSAEDLIARAHKEQPDLAAEVLQDALQRLERDSGLVRRERRHDVDLYELVSEFLIPRISAKRRELQREQERAKARRRLVIVSCVAAIAALVIAALVFLAIRFYNEEQTAKQATARATRATLQASYSGLQSTAQALAATRPDLAVLLSLAADLHVPPGIKPALAASTLLGYEERYVEEVSHSGQLAILGGHSDTVTSVAFDPRNSNRVVSASGDGTVRLWDVGTRSQLGSVTGRQAVFSLAFSPTGAMVATGSADGTVRVYDVAGGQLTSQSRPLGSSVIDVAFSPDGHELAAATGGEQIAIWHSADGAPIAHLTTLKDPTLRSIAFSPDSRTLAAVGTDGAVRLWPATGGAPRMTLHVLSPLYSVAFRPGSSVLAAGGLEGRVWLWNDATGRLLAQMSQGAAVNDLAFSPDGSKMGAALSDGSVRISAATGFGASDVLRGHTGTVTALAFSPDGRLVATGSTDRTVRLWTLMPHHEFGDPLPNAPARFVSTVAFSRDGSELAAGTAGPPGVWLSREGVGASIPRRLPTRSEVRSVAFSPSGGLVASATQDGTVQLWNTASGQPAGPPIFHRPGDPVYAVAFSPTAPLIAFADNRGRILLYNRAGHTVMALPTRLGIPIYSLAFSPDGSLLASGGDDRVIRLWSVDRRTQIGSMAGDTDAIFSVAFSPDGRTLASASADETARLWNVRRRTQIGPTLTGFASYVRSVAFSRDGGTLAASSYDGTIRLWDVGSGIAIGEPLSANSASVEGVAFAPTGVLASGGGDGATRLWPGILLPADPRELEAQVCKVVGSGLTPAQWAAYAPSIPYEPLCSGGTP